MINRISEKNINTKEYLDKEYTDFKRPSVIDNRLQQLVDQLKEYEFVLDMGCADGTFIKLYQKKYPKAEVYGCDLSSEAVKLCGRDCLQSDIYHTPYVRDSFDLIVCLEVLEHLERPQEAIDEMKRVLKVGGMLVLTTPNENDGACDEHLWRWDMKGVRSFLKGFKVIEKNNKFFSEQIMLLKCKKLA